jgi:cytochrome P450
MLFKLESRPEEYLRPFFDNKNAVWKICGFNDVYSILHNPDALVSDAPKNLTLLQSRSNLDFLSLIQMFNGTLIFRNHIDHERGRNFLKKGLLINSALVSSATIKGEIRKILSSIPLNQEIDAISLISNKIPASVMGNLLGLEMETCNELALLNSSLVGLWEPLQPISNYMQGNLIAKKAIELISKNISLNKKNHVLNSWFSMGQRNYQLSKSEISSLLLFFFIVGIEETSAFLGNALLILLTETQLNQPNNFIDGNLQPYIYEMLRFCGPIRSVSHRTFSNPIVLSGTEIPPNSAIECNVELAHFDPNIFKNPCIFDPSREGPRPIVFGGGVHSCIGRRLTLVQVSLLLQELSLNYKLVKENVNPQWDNHHQPLRRQKDLLLTLSHQ